MRPCIKAVSIGFVFSIAALGATLQGVVKNSITGIALPRAHVSCNRTTVSTGADGRFVFRDLPAGACVPEAERVGFVKGSTRARVVLKQDEARSDVEISLIPTGSISGHVTDGDGHPVEGAFVNVQSSRYGEYRTTDDKGEFRIGGLPPGKYRVKATSAGGGIFAGPPEIRTDGTTEVHYAGTYYPGALSEAQAGRVVVRPGAETNGIDVQLMAVPFVRVSGKVIGGPRNATEIFVLVSQGPGGTGAAVHPDGSFEIWRLDPGKYWLTAEWNGNDGGHGQTAGIEIDVAGSNIDDIELRVVPPSDIAGRVEFENDVKRETGEKLELILSPTGPALENAADAEVDTDGSFHLQNVAAGKYRLQVATEGFRVKSMRLGSASMDGNTLDLSNGSGGAELSVQIAAAKGAISGVVRDSDGKPMAAEVILQEPDSESRSSSRKLNTKPDGVYDFSELAPGVYKIVAVQDVDDYEDLLEEVKLDADEKVTKDLKLQMPQ